MFDGRGQPCLFLQCVISTHTTKGVGFRPQGCFVERKLRERERQKRRSVSSLLQQSGSAESQFQWKQAKEL